MGFITDLLYPRKEVCAPRGQDLLLLYALSLTGVPYKWGGRSPKEGLDCSNLVRILLHSQGIELDNAYSAAELFLHFSRLHPVTQTEQKPSFGSLIFYGKNKQDIEHVAMALSATTQIESAGGDHTTLTITDAIEKAAFVRITPIRANLFQGAFLPPYPWS